MFYPLAVFIGLRYTRAKRRTRFISFISASSMMGVALGVTALITVLSIMNGFEQELRHRILGMVAHATVTGPGDRLQNWQAVATTVARDPQIAAWAPYVEGQGMLVTQLQYGMKAYNFCVLGSPGTNEPYVSLGKYKQVI